MLRSRRAARDYLATVTAEDFSSISAHAPTVPAAPRRMCQPGTGRWLG